MISETDTNSNFIAKDERVPLITKIRETKDRGWAWMVLAGSLLCHFIFGGQFLCFGVFYIAIREKLSLSVVEVSVIGSLRNGLMLFCVVFTSPLCSVLGCRIMALTGGALSALAYIVCCLWPSILVFYSFLGVITGIASAMVYSSSLIAINSYFERRRSFCFSMTIFIMSLGGIVLSPLTTFLLDSYGLESTLLIHAGISFNILVGGMLYVPQTSFKTNGTVSMREWVLKVIEPYKDQWIWKNKLFYVMMTSSFCVAFGIYVPFLLMPDFMVSQNIPMERAALSVTIMGAGQMVGSVLAGVISNHFPRLNRLQFVCGNLLASAFLYLIPFRNTEYHYLTVAGGFAFCYGFIGSLRIILLVDLFESRRLPVTFGITSITFGIASIAGAPVASYIAEIVQITGIEYVVAAVFLTVGGILLLPLPRKCKRDENLKLPSR